MASDNLWSAVSLRLPLDDPLMNFRVGETIRVRGILNIDGLLVGPNDSLPAGMLVVVQGILDGNFIEVNRDNPCYSPILVHKSWFEPVAPYGVKIDFRVEKHERA